MKNVRKWEERYGEEVPVSYSDIFVFVASFCPLCYCSVWWDCYFWCCWLHLTVQNDCVDTNLAYVPLILYQQNSKISTFSREDNN